MGENLGSPICDFRSSKPRKSRLAALLLLFLQEKNGVTWILSYASPGHPFTADEAGQVLGEVRLAQLLTLDNIREMWLLIVHAGVRPKV